MTAVTHTRDEKVTPHPIIELFTSDTARRYIEKFLPEGTDLERVAATVLLAIQSDKTKTLGKCTPESLIMGVARIQQWGLDLGVTAYLLPFGKTATPVASYQGLAELMVASGAVRHVEARAVYQGDHFAYQFGTAAELTHRPCAKANRGEITHAYCIIHLPFGRQVFDVMSAEDIEAIRQNYSQQWKKGPLPSWYAKKTVVRQASKLVPKNPRLAKALAVLDDDRKVEEDPEPTAPAVASLGTGSAPDASIRQDDLDLVERETSDDDTPSVPF